MKILWLYTLLLRLYPREFYDRFNTEMIEVFTQAWRRHLHRRTSLAAFCLHEFGGLLLSIVIEHRRANSRFGLRRLFRRRFVPLWLFVFSLVPAALLSQSYWGYVIVPASTISAVSSIDQIALVRFDAGYTPSVIPINELPNVVIPDFPPSQILSNVPPVLDIDEVLDPALVTHLSEALAREGVELGTIIEHPREPVVNPNGCGMSCFWSGVQPQLDGSLLVIYPEVVLEGQQRIEGMTMRVTPNEPGYYDLIKPAGYVVQGRDAHGSPIVFTAIASRVGGDRNRYYELTFTQASDGLILRNRLSYNFDISGLEGMNLPWIILFLFAPLLALWFTIRLLGSLMSVIGKRVTRWQSIA